MTENELHEYVAEIEGHDSQVTGVVGYFYEMYRREVIARVQGTPNREILEVGCGEGMMFEGTAIAPVQMDVSMRRVQLRARQRASRRSAATATSCRLPTARSRRVLLIAMLEHTSEPWRVLAEARRVLKPGGRAIIVVPNDVTMSAGRAGAGQVSDPLSRSPDVHDAGPHAPLAGGRLPRHGRVSAAVPAAAVRGESLLLHRSRRRVDESVRMSKPKVVILGAGPGRHVGGVAADRARLSGHGARARRRGRRHGPDHQGRRLLGRLRAAHVSHPRDRREQGDPEDDHAVLRRGPADAGARHARAAARQGIRLSARDAAGAVRRQPAAVGADPVRLRRWRR